MKSPISKTLASVSVLALAVSAASQAMAGTTTAISLTPQKIAGNDNSQDIALSKGGAHGAFESDAYNIVLGDGNNARDIFFRLGVSTITRISVNSRGEEASNSGPGVDWFDNNNHADSNNPSITSDGKLVAFESLADNLDLLTKDTNNDVANNTESDIFVRDVAKKKTYRISGIMDAADGNIQPNLTDVDGNALVKTDAPWKIITQANDRSTNPAIAGTAKQAWVAFESRATNLIPGLTVTAGRTHIYTVDLKTKKIEIVDATHDAAGVALVEANNSSFAPQVSPDGRFVVYYSSADNLVSPAVATAGNRDDVFIYDRKKFVTYQLSGVRGTPSSSNGYTVVTEGNDNSSMPSIAGGGTSKTKSYVVAFDSRASNLDTIAGGDGDGDRDVFVVEFAAANPKDANTAYEIKSLKRISAPMDAAGTISAPGSLQGDATAADSRNPVIAGTSLSYKVAFRSTADNLLPNPLSLFWNQDSNRVQDIYVYSNSGNTFIRANVDVAGVQGTSTANNPAISPDGSAVGFDTTDQYLVPDLFGNGDLQTYIRKL